MKEIIIKNCKNCGQSYFDNNKKLALEPRDLIDVIIVKVPYCPVCNESYQSELNQKTSRKSWKEN